MRYGFCRLEADPGLRSFNRRVPEEINRVLTDLLAELLFAPTAAALSNLASEGIVGPHVHLVGEVMQDAVLFYGKLAAQRSDILRRFDLQPGADTLCTVHRAENTGDPQRLRSIVGALSTLAREIQVVLPLHPRTLAGMRNMPDESGMIPVDLLSAIPAGLRVIEPLGYLDMMRLEASAAVIVTDSGGVQKEAYFHPVPCVTLRHETEWVELVEAGWNRLAPPDQAPAILDAIQGGRGSKGRKLDLYGKGDAAPRIVQALKNFAAQNSEASLP